MALPEQNVMLIYLFPTLVHDFILVPDTGHDGNTYGH